MIPWYNGTKNHTGGTIPWYDRTKKHTGGIAKISYHGILYHEIIPVRTPSALYVDYETPYYYYSYSKKK